MLNYLTYNGKKSTDLGVYVTGSGSFDAAEMDADKYEIAGRNGDLIIPKNRYKNIVVNYPAFIPKAFQNKAQSIRNWMRSAKAYARLEDTYDMEHFRLGLASGIQSFEPVNRNDASNFQLSFDCRPERFLKTGETPLTVEPEAHTYSGEIVEFETVAVDDMTKAEVSLSPIQPLNGYDHPWAGGAGKNKFPYPVERDVTYSNVHFVSDGKGKITITGTASGNNDATFALTDYFVIPDGSQYELCFLNTEGKGIVQFLKDATVIDSWTLSSAYRHSSYVGMSNKECNRVKFIVTQGETYNQTLQIMFLLSSDVTNTYIPYSNLCPITGHDSATLNIGAEYPTPDDSYPVTFPQTVYGGTFDWVSGKLKVTQANIASYAGEALPGAWISDRDVYAAGTTPTTGAQVVYELATPTEIDLTPAQVQTLLGLNNVWASDGSVEIAYSDPFNVDNPTYFEARPLFEITNPAQNDVLNVNGKTITFLSGYTGTVTIDCETMDAYSSSGTNLNYLISATDFPVLNEGVNIVTWSGSGSCKMTPRWWEL